MDEPSSTPVGDKEIRENCNRIHEGIERIKVGLERMMVVLDNMVRQEELKMVEAARSQSTRDHKEEMESSKISGPVSGHKNNTLIESSSITPSLTFTSPGSPETKLLPATVLDHPRFGHHRKVKSALFTNAAYFSCSPCASIFNTCGLKLTGIKENIVMANSRNELVNFELSNLSRVHSKETSRKKTSCTCQVLDEMPKRDLHVDSLYNGTIERNNITEVFEDLFLDAFFIDNKSDVEAFENMHLGWLFLDDESDMDTKSLASDWKEVLSWHAHFDLIISKVMTSCDLWFDFERCDLWFDFESDMRTQGKIWPWEEIDKLLFLITEERLKLIAEEGVKVWVENKKCNQLFLLFQSFAPSLRLTSPTVEGAASFGQNGQPFAVINSLGQTHKYGENGFDFGGVGKMLPFQVVSLAEKLEKLELDECEAFEVETKKQNNINIEGFLIATYEFNINSVKPMVNFDIARNYDVLGYRIEITFGSIYKIMAGDYEDTGDDITKSRYDQLVHHKLPSGLSQFYLIREEIIHHFYGPIQIAKRVGPMAYTLLFAPSVKIHPTVHFSLLKRCYKVSDQILFPLVTNIASLYCPKPEAMLQRRMVKRKIKAVAQVLVKWKGLSAGCATWEFFTTLKSMFPHFDP